MASGDVNIQSAVHSVDQGKVAFAIRIGMLAAILLAVALLYLFVQFRGLNNSSAMDQAQIARNLASGNGYTTQFIRPVALNIMKKSLPQGESLDLSRFPDFYQSPLNPFVNSIALKMVSGSWKMAPTDIVYAGDRAIAVMGVLFFLAAVAVWFIVISKIFDQKLAFYATIAVLGTDLMWQFSLSGLPQMLVLFLFSLASLATVYAMEAHDADRTIASFAFIGAGAFFMGLMTLGHGLSFWIFLGWLIFVVLYFTPRIPVALLALAAYLIVVSPWIVRNYQVSGLPLGLSVYDAFYDSAPEETYQRIDSPRIAGSGVSIQALIRVNLMRQLDTLFSSFGLNIAAIGFFFAILHPFRNRKAAMFKWCILSMWVFSVLGMSLFRGLGTVNQNQIHVLFIPLFVAFGFAFLLVLWSRMEFGGPVMRTVFICVALFVCSIPLLMTLFAGQQSRIQWPPYVPPFISILGDWFNKDEVVASDMPWAVAWYADRTSLLLPESMRVFNRIRDYAETKQPIVGLYLTPVSGNSRLFSDIYKGAYKEWSGLITRPPKTDNFPLQAMQVLPIAGECIIFADRDRWSQPAGGSQ